LLRRDPCRPLFIVNGHDAYALNQLELILHRLQLDPFILQNTAGGGLTIIEALEKEIGLNAGAARFGIVLLTPDDIGYAQSGGPSHAKPRARQNVVLKMGMLIAALGRPNVVILKKGEVEIPSDAHGIIYAEFTAHVKEIVIKLVQRLGAAGFKLTSDAIGKASA
jgi:predicted nucleotide-binding protein